MESQTFSRCFRPINYYSKGSEQKNICGSVTNKQYAGRQKDYIQLGS